MSAANALLLKAADDFRDYLRPLMREKHFTLASLAELATGKKNTGLISKILRGEARMSDSMCQKVAAAMEIPVEDLRERYRPVADARALVAPQLGRPPGARRLERPPVQPLQPPGLPPLPPLAPWRQLVQPEAPQFSLVVDKRGRATIQLHMTDVAMDVALRVMAAITTSGLLGGSDPPAEQNPKHDQQNYQAHGAAKVWAPLETGALPAVPAAEQDE